MRHLIDCQDGHKVSTFAQVRSCNSASFRTVDQVTEQAIAVATCDPKCYQLFVENPPINIRSKIESLLMNLRGMFRILIAIP